ncbi:hypothetical protein [Thermoanaerobacter siderophilus]|nr:hypothetical protein [Thermoanaerobacter siderophilus]
MMTKEKVFRMISLPMSSEECEARRRIPDRNGMLKSENDAKIF